MYYQDRGLTVGGVLDIESPYWTGLTVVDVKHMVVCFNGRMDTFVENKDMSVYRDNVKTRPVLKATSNGETLNLFIR